MRRLEMESKPQIPAPRSVSGDEPDSARIGPYHVVRHLVSGPGAQMMEAAGGDGTQVLLQIVRCRGARNTAEETERNEMLESVAVATAELAKEFSIHDHGSTDAEGESILWWAMPWDERAVELGLAKIDDPEELLGVGIHLAKRLARTHARNRLDALLSERLLVIKNGEPWIAGVPIRVPDRWLSPGMRAARLAPEESLAKEPTRAGDVWRLGQTLKAMTVYLERLPTRIWRALELLGHPDVGVRIRSADEAVSLMESLADPLAPDPPSISDVTSAQRPPAVEKTVEDDRIAEDATTVADEPLASGTRRLNDQAETQPGAKPPRVLARSGDELLEFGDTHQEQSDEALPLEEAAIPQMRKKRGTWDTGTYSDAPVGPTGTMTGPKLPSSALAKRHTTTPGAKRLEPGALPPRMLAPAGLLAGPKGTLVGAGPIEPRQIMRVPRTVIADESEQETPAEITPDVAAAGDEEPEQEQDGGLRFTTVPNPRTAGIAMLTFVVGLLFGAIAAKLMRVVEDDPSLLASVVVVPSSNLVRIDAEPAASAIVVSEEDGRVLGPTPIWFQVPTKDVIAVLVTAPGHEPQRLLLSAHGHLKVVLQPKYTQRDSCQVNLHVPQDVPVESIGTSIEETAGGFQIPGSAVIRAVGEIRGAWLVRCPGFGSDGVLSLDGRKMEKQIELRVSNPPDMEVWIDDEAIGTSPLRKRISSGFKHVRLKSAKGDNIERWAPLFEDSEVEFPYPN